jgi:hypothetical protein
VTSSLWNTGADFPPGLYAGHSCTRHKLHAPHRGAVWRTDDWPLHLKATYPIQKKKKGSFWEFVILHYKLQIFAHHSTLDTDICVPVDELTRRTTGMKNVPRSVRETLCLMRTTLHRTVVTIHITPALNIYKNCAFWPHSVLIQNQLKENFTLLFIPYSLFRHLSKYLLQYATCLLHVAQSFFRS